MTDGVASPASTTVQPVGGAPGPAPIVEGWMPFRLVFDLALVGPPPRDDGRDARSTASATTTSPASGRYAEAEGAAARHARRARQHDQPPDELLGPEPHDRSRSSPRSTSCRASATTAPRRSARRRRRFHDVRRVVSNLGVFDFDDAGPRACAWCRCIRASASTRCVKSTGFELVIPDDVPEHARADRRGTAPDPRGDRSEGRRATRK